MALAYQQAYEASRDVLRGLAECLTQLRNPLTTSEIESLLNNCGSPVAKRMILAAQRFYTHPGVEIHTDKTIANNKSLIFATADAATDNVDATHGAYDLPYITPMICVAGAVADHILQAMLTGTQLQRVYINNGGDIALWLSPQSTFTVGICSNEQSGEIASQIKLRAEHHVQGIATSGWRGRSHSLGVADAVTVLADSAAIADAAATLIANAVDIPDCAQIHRLPACELSPESDLRNKAVTVDVDTLSQKQIESALARGQCLAEQLRSSGHIKAAYLSLADTVLVCADAWLAEPEHLEPEEGMLVASVPEYVS